MSALQEERSAETRRRLLDATVACLFERGYAGTTTTEIASRAGVSRGAQLHHFPRKDELVVSALEYVFELRLSELSAAIAERPSGSREHRLAIMIDTIWPGFKGPTFYAWLELVVASRTDPALNDAVRAASVRFGEGFRIGLATLLDCVSKLSSKVPQWLAAVEFRNAHQSIVIGYISLPSCFMIFYLESHAFIVHSHLLNWTQIVVHNHALTAAY